MKIQKNELVQKLNKIKSVVPKNPKNPILQGVLVKNGYLIASNLEMTVKVKIEGAEKECFIIPAKAFDLISNLPDGEIEIVSEENNITIKAAKISNKYKTMNPTEFPETSIPEGEKQDIILDSYQLLKSMKRVSYAVPAQSPNIIMTAMFLQAKDGYLNFVGLDGHVLAWDKVKYTGDFNLLLPKATVDKLQSIGLKGNISIKYSDRGTVFVTEEYEVYTRLIDGKYFKYQDMFNELSLHTVITRVELLDAMVRAKLCTEERCPVKFEISGDTLNVSIKNSTTDYHETIALQEPLTEDLTIGFNARLVLETLKAFDCDNIGIQLQASKSPMIVEAENSDFMAIVLPVAIN